MQHNYTCLIVRAYAVFLEILQWPAVHTSMPEMTVKPLAVLVWGQAGTSPQILPRRPKFLIGYIVISLSRCCLPNDETPAPPNFFPRTATALKVAQASSVVVLTSRIYKHVNSLSLPTFPPLPFHTFPFPFPTSTGALHWVVFLITCVIFWKIQFLTSYSL